MRSETPKGGTAMLSHLLERPPETMLSHLASLIWRKGVRATCSSERKEMLYIL